MWPANIHSIGKDILRFHAIYWPAMLMAGGVEPPTQVWAHGYLTVGGKKMSKTNATGIHPFELLDEFGVDSYRYYFMREIQFGQDGSFSCEAMVERHNADLANGLGQPREPRPGDARRATSTGVVPAFTVEGAESDLPAVTADAAARYQTHMERVELSPALAATWEIVARANHYLVEKEPWKIKDEARRDELASILYASAETLRILAVLISPIMPRAASVLWSQLGIAGAARGSAPPAGRRVGRPRRRNDDDEGREPVPAARHRVATAAQPSLVLSTSA